MDGSRESASRSAREGRRHPIFARFFDRLSRATEHEVSSHRDRLLAGLSGRVLEVGAGNGVNFGHYPPTVEKVVALEPEPFMRDKARHAATNAGVTVQIIDGAASRLPFESSSFDAAVASLVLCSVPELATALSEVRRVLKDGGELRFMEHVRADQPAKARLQIMLDRSRIWPLLGGGCHCSRQTMEAIAAAGFRVTEFESLPFGPSWWITNPHVRGAARWP
jgi:ubiquinone/menaquinone biosynthesis C-methylase UbiE